MVCVNINFVIEKIFLRCKYYTVNIAFCKDVFRIYNTELM